MPYYEYSLYAPTRRALVETAETLVSVWEFDPTDVKVRPSWSFGRFARLTRILRRLVGIRHQEDFHLFITGPEIYRSKVHAVVEAWDGYCDGGGYDFGYDPTQYYTNDQIRLHTVKWEAQNAEAERRYMASLPEDEQARVRKAMEDLTSHIKAHESDE